MTGPRDAMLLSLGFAALISACTSHQPEPIEQAPAPAIEVAVAPVLGQAPAIVEQAPELAPTLPETPIVPIPATTQWRELPGMESVVGFHPFVFGVLVICGPNRLDDICKLLADDTLEPGDVDFPEPDALAGGERKDDHQMVGNWRSDAWMVTSEAGSIHVEEDDRGDVNFEQLLVLRKLRTHTWYPSPIGDSKRVKDSGQQVRKGWAGGMLVYDRPNFIRVPGSGPPTPTLGETRPGQLADFFEAASGRLYSVVMTPDETTWVQRPCASRECVTANAFPLPGGLWDFRVDAPRGEDGISVIAQARVRDDERPGYLLHFDAALAGGRWALESWPSAATRPLPPMLWPDTRSGVWVPAGDALWYRDGEGQWFDVALPFAVEPGDRIQFANRMKPRELVVLLVRAGVGRVFASKGLVQAS